MHYVWPIVTNEISIYTTTDLKARKKLKEKIKTVE